MKRTLILLVLFLTACASPGTQPTPIQTPGPFTDTVPAPVMDPSGSPPPNVGVTATLPPASPAVSDAKTFPDPTAYKWTDIVSGFVSPDDIQFPDDSSGRMFVVEQAGRILVVENGRILAPAFLDIRDRVGAEAMNRVCWAWPSIRILKITHIST